MKYVKTYEAHSLLHDYVIIDWGGSYELSKVIKITNSELVIDKMYRLYKKPNKMFKSNIIKLTLPNIWTVSKTNSIDNLCYSSNDLDKCLDYLSKILKIKKYSL